MNGRPLRILHIVQHLHGYGAERQLAALLPRLQSPEMVAGVLTVYAPSPDELTPPGVPTIYIGRTARGDFTFVRRLLSGVRTFAPDVVHTHTHSGKYWGRFAAVAVGVRAIVHTEHNPCDPRRSVLQRIAGRALNPYTTRCVTFFPEQGAMVARMDGVSLDKMVFIPNGLEFSAMTSGDRQSSRELLGLSAQDFAIMLVGRMEYQKNHELAIRALAAVPRESRAGLVLLLAGSGSLEPTLRELTLAFDVADRVRFLGYRSDVPKLLAGADLFLMTSHFEGMPLSVLEGMHAGVPILTTPWLGSKSMLGTGRYGRIAESWDASDLATEIVGARTHRESLLEMADRARSYVVSEFDLSRMVEAHTQLYRELCSSERSAA